MVRGSPGHGALNDVLIKNKAVINRRQETKR